MVVTPSASQLIVAAAIIDDFKHPTAVLAARRSSPKRLAGRWEFPGGKIESNESPEDALHRELTEELGISVSLGTRIDGPGGDWPILHGLRMRVWFARISSGSPAPLQDHDELRWLPLADAFTVPWLDPDEPIVTAMLAQAQAQAQAPAPAPAQAP